MAGQPSLDDIFGPSAAAQQPVQQSLSDILGPASADSAPQDIMSRTGADVSQRINNLQDIQNQVDSGKISAPSGFLQRMGQVAGAGVIDPTNEIAKSASSYIPDAIPNAIRTAGSYLPGMDEYQGSINNYAKNATPIIQNFQKSHPEISGDVGAVGNIAGVLPAAEGIEAAGKGVMGAAGLGRDALNAISDSSTGNGSSIIGRMAKPVTNLAKSASTVPEDQAKNFWADKVTPEKAQEVKDGHYAFAATQNNAYDESVRDQYKDAVNSMFPPPNKNTLESAVKPVYSVQSIIDNINNSKGPLTLKEYQKFSQDLNQFYTPVATPESRQAAMLKGALEDTINNAPESARVSGTQAGWDALDNAKQAHGVYKTLGALQAGIDDAATRAQPATSLDRFLINFTKKNPDALTSTEKQIASDATKTDVKGTIYRAAGSRLVPYATGVGGELVGGIPGAMISGAGGATAAMAARQAGFASKLDKIDDLVKSVGNRLPKESPPIPDKASPSPQPHPSSAGYNPGTEPIPAAMNANFVRNPSPTDLGPVGSASIPEQASFVRQPNPTDLGYTGGASLPGPAGYAQEPHPSAAGYRGSPVSVQDVGNAAHSGPVLTPAGNLGFGKPVGKVNLPMEEWPGYVAKEEGQKSGGRIKGKIGFKLKKSKI